MHNKKTIKPFIDKPVILIYHKNGYEITITGKVIECHYIVKFRKIEDKKVIPIKYHQIDGIGLMPDISENNMEKYKALKKIAENRVLIGKHEEAISYYKRILEIIRPNTIKSNNIKSCILDCENIINSRIEDSITDGSMELRDNLKGMS